MEAITILFAYNFCLGLLSSAVLLSGEGCQLEPVQIEKMSVSAAEVAVIVNKNTSNIQIEPDELIQQEQQDFTEDEQQQKEVSEEVPEEAYVCESVEPEEQEMEYEPQEVCCFSEGFDSSFKAYMDYRCITDTNSIQYQLQTEAYTDERGFRRIGDDYCVALGTGITNGCCERFLITLDSGYSFSAIVADVKADIHTDSTNSYAPLGDNAGNVVEFIIDSDNADGYMLSSGSAGCFEDLSGNIISIEKI